jgi:hypothetical protein
MCQPESIDPAEVDRVVEALDTLGESVRSETIRMLLEDAANSIYYLVYDDQEDAASEAA